MSTYPDTPRSDFLAWCQAHEGVFVANAAQIGLTPAQATVFKKATDDTAAASLAQEQAKQAAKVGTQVASGAFNKLRGSAGETVRLIRAFAESQTDPSVVYNLAQIPPPAEPSPAPPPAHPTELTVTLDASRGALALRWKAANPAGTSGTSYIIRRKLPGETDFSFIGVSGKKEFVDDTLIAGPDSVQYTVQGQRADSSGPVSPVFTINFGRSAGGALTASVANSVRERIHAQAGAGDRSLVDAIVNSKPLGNGHATRERARV